MYRIRNWTEHFENDRSRTRDRCSFACVPNKQHGMGFTRVMMEPDGMAIYGIWCAIVGACSQQKRPREGYLTDDGTPEGYAWTAQDLADRWRRPLQEAERALSVLSSDRIGWLEQLPADSPPTPRLIPWNGREGKGREGNGKEVKRREENGIEELAPATPTPTLVDKESTPPTDEGKAHDSSHSNGGSTRPTDAVKVQRPRKIPDSDHARLIAYWKAAWERRWRVEFVMVGGKDGNHFKFLLDHAKSLQRACEIVDCYLADDSPFVREKFHPLGVLVGQISTYAAKSAARKNGAAAVRKLGEKVVNWS